MSAMTKQTAAAMPDAFDAFINANRGRHPTYGCLGAMHDVYEKIFTVQRDWIRALEQRIAALEAQPKALEYRGVYEIGSTYEKNDVVTHAGSMWVCLNRTGLRPDHQDGSAERAWQLAVKKGRDLR